MLRRPVESAQYLSIGYTKRLAEAGIEPSVVIEDVELANLEWVWWFNHHRLFGPIGDIPPGECEETYDHHGSEARATGALLT